MRESSYRQSRVRSTLSLVPSASPPAVRQAWVDFLSRYQWNCFATLTWQRSAGREQVERDFRQWVSKWMGNEAVLRGLARWAPLSKPFANDGPARLRGWLPNRQRDGHEQTVWALGIEPHASGKLHAHALLRFPECFGEVMLTHGWDLWFNGFKNGYARLEPPHSQDGCVQYVSKYVIKGRSELVLSESFKAPPSMSV